MDSSNTNSGFHEFVLSCKTFDPGFAEPRSIPNWPMIRKLCLELEDNNRLLVVKSRQMMVTWIGCAWMLYKSLTSGPGIHLLLSKEERSAKELINRIRFLVENLLSDEELCPDLLKDRDIRFQSGAVSFPEDGVRIISLPAAPYAVRGLSPRTVFWDEMAFTPDDDEIWASVKPAVDAGGTFFGVSTPNGPGGVFAKLVNGNEKGFKVVRIHYSEHRERTDDWEEKARAGLSPARWRREQELSFEGAEGCVYDQFDSQLHLLEENHTPSLEQSIIQDSPSCGIYRGIDFGYRKPAVVWTEYKPDGSLVIFDCLVGDKWPVNQLVQEIRRIDNRHGISEKDVRWTAVDPAGAAKSDFGISPVEHLQAEGFKVIWSVSTISSGIEAVRALLNDAAGNVRLKIDKRCTSLVHAFQGYVWGADGDVPVKDGIHDHPMDALRYLVVNLVRSEKTGRGPMPKVSGLPPPPRSAPI